MKKSPETLDNEIEARENKAAKAAPCIETLYDRWAATEPGSRAQSQAADALVKALEPNITASARAVAGNFYSSEYDELAQETRIAVARALTRYNPRNRFNASFTTFIIAVLNREANASACRAIEGQPQTYGLTPTAQTVDWVPGTDRKLTVDRALERLPSKWRRIIIARRIEGCTLEETARMEGCSAENIRQIQARAEEQLRHLLGGEDALPDLLG